MIKQLLALFATTTIASTCLASNISVVDFSGSGATFAENVLKTTSGQTFATGAALIRIGYFSNFSAGDSALMSALTSTTDRAATYAAIASRFVPLGEGVDVDLGVYPGTPPNPASGPRLATRTINGVTGIQGRLAGAVNSIKPVGGAANSFDPQNIAGVPIGSRIFILAYDNLNAANATSMAIVSADNWLMPSDDLSNLTLNTVDVNTASEYVRGTVGSIGMVSWIPEPSASLLGLIGSLALLRRRRK